MNLILFGFNTSRKTHFGKLLAHQMNRPFINTDDLILAKQGSSLLLSLKNVTNSIIVLGEKILLDSENIAILQTVGALVFLKAGAEGLQQKIPARVIDTDALDEAGVLAALRSTLVLEDHPDGL